MSQSTFFCDGYRAAETGMAFSPPYPSIYAAEYQRGYNAFFDDRGASERAAALEFHKLLASGAVQFPRGEG